MFFYKVAKELSGVFYKATKNLSFFNKDISHQYFDNKKTKKKIDQKIFFLNFGHGPLDIVQTVR